MSSAPSLPPGWAFIPLGNLGEWNGGGTPSKSEPSFWADGSIPWVSPKDMKVLVISDSIDHITEKAVKESAAKLIDAGSVLFVTRSGILSHTFPVARTVVPVTVNQDLKALTPTPPLDPNYIAWGSRAYGSTILEQCSKDGTTVASVDTTLLHGFRLPIAPLPEQHRIVEAIESYFTRLDDAVATLERVQRNLKRYRASVLKAAVEGRLVPTEAALARAEGRDYEPASVLLERILDERRRRWEEAELAKMKANGKTPKNDKWKAKYKAPEETLGTELPQLPEGWAWTTVDALQWDGGYGTSQKCRVEADGPPVLRIPNVQGQALNFDDLKFAVDSAKLLPNGILRPGDFIFIRTNGSKSLVGRGALVTQELPRDYYFASYLIRLRLATDLLTSRWFALTWHVPIVRDQILRDVGSSAGQHNVSLSAARSYFVPIPPLDEQERILSQVERLLSISDSGQALGLEASVRCESLRRSILKWAFEGRLVDQDQSDEPATLLLERMRVSRQSSDKQPQRPANRRRPMVKKVSKNSQRNLLETLVAAGQPLTPEQLLVRAGFSTESIGDFYDALREAVNSGEIRETRPDKRGVLLEVESK